MDRCVLGAEQKGELEQWLPIHHQFWAEGCRGLCWATLRVVSNDGFKEERQTGFPFPPEISPPPFFFQTEAKFHLFKLII